MSGPCRVLILAVSLCLAAPAGAGAFDLQGHRGARGLAPENTLAAFALALEIGVTTLETDLAVTSDDVVVLSHDPTLNPDLARRADGAWVQAPGPTVARMTLAELQSFDVGRLRPGSRYAQQFPDQKPIDGTRIPTLEELFALAKTSGRQPHFNIETKLAPDKPNDTLGPEAFARRVIEVVRAAGMAERVTIQSFDWRTLLAVRRLAPEIATVCLTSPSNLRDQGEGPGRRPSAWLAGLDPADHGNSAARLSKAAGCRTWSPHFGGLTVERVAEAQALGLRVVPWTVSTPEEMAGIIDMKVDGLITDYPDRARALLAHRGIAVD